MNVSVRTAAHVGPPRCVCTCSYKLVKSFCGSCQVLSCQACLATSLSQACHKLVKSLDQPPLVVAFPWPVIACLTEVSIHQTGMKL